jgi:hypothetical protein
MRSYDLNFVVVMPMMFSSWATVAWPSVGNSCVSRVVPFPSAKANSLVLVLVSLGGIPVGSSGARIILVPLPPLTGMLWVTPLHKIQQRKRRSEAILHN